MLLHPSEQHKSECKYIWNCGSNSTFTLPYSDFVSLFFSFTFLSPFLHAVQQHNTKTVLSKTKKTLNAKSGDQRPVCWLVFMKWCVTTILTGRPETCRAVCYDIILQFMQCKILPFVCWFIFMRFHVQMTIYWCVTENESGLINSSFAWCCFICWEIFTLAFGCYLNWHSFGYYFYVQMIEKQQSYLFLDLKLFEWCHAIFSFLLGVLCTGWPGTCAMTEIQYLNVFGLAAWTGFIELQTV